MISMATLLASAAGNTTSPGGCIDYWGGGNSDRLFDYYRTSGDVQQPVAAQRMPGTGFCYYPTAGCDTDDCCKVTSWVSDSKGWATTSCTYSQLALYFLTVFLTVKMAKREVARMSEAGGSAPPARGPPSGIPEFLNQLGVYAGISVGIFVSIKMADSTQGQLHVAERNAMLAAGAVLTPIKDVFQFLEDTTSVKLAFAIGTGNFDSIRSVVLLGLAGGLLTGAAGAVLLTGVACWPALIEALLVPGSKRNEELFQGCSLLPSAGAILDTARSLWLLSAWAWPFQFCGMTLSGLLMGSREFALYGVCMVLGQMTTLAVWFQAEPQERTLVRLGWAGFLSSAVGAASMLLVIALNRPMREKFGLRLRSGLTGRHSSGADSVGRRVVLDGLMAMVVDLVIQLCGTSSVFVAGFQNMPTLYQLSAAGAAMPTFTAFSVGLGFVMRMQGSILVGRRWFSLYKKFVLGIAGAAVLLGLAAVVCILPHRDALAAAYSVQSCQFAGSARCLGIYSGIFDGRDNIFGVFDVFTASAFSLHVFSVAKSGLYSCQDFAFMAKAAPAVALAVFVPALLVARLHFQTASALYLAGQLPVWVLTVVFGARLRQNISRMLKGASGPWDHAPAEGEPAEGELPLGAGSSELLPAQSSGRAEGLA